MEPRDLATIRLVTQRYRELQGLHLALPGAMFMIGSGAFLSGLIADGVVGSIVGFGGCLLLCFAGEYLKHHYATRFGSVDERGASAWAVGGLLVSGYVLGVVTMWAEGPVGLMFVPFALMHSWIVVRDFPYRNYHLIGAAASATAIALVGPADAAAGGLGLIHAGVVQGAAWVVVGLLDHRKLSILRVPGSAGREDRAHTEAQSL